MPSEVQVIKLTDGVSVSIVHKSREGGFGTESDSDRQYIKYNSLFLQPSFEIRLFRAIDKASKECDRRNEIEDDICNITDNVIEQVNRRNTCLKILPRI